VFAGGTEMNCKEFDLSAKAEFVGCLAELESLLQAFSSSVVERAAKPCKRN
jgi:hypothetical protein